MASYNPYEQKILGYERQQKMAEQLRNAQMPEGQMVSGHYVAANPLGQLGALLRQYAGINMEEKALKGIESTRAEQGQALRDWQAAMPQTKRVGDEWGGNVQTIKPTAEDYMAWGQQGLGIDPQAAQMGMQNAQVALTRESNEANRRLAIEAEAKRDRERAQDRSDQIRLAASLRPSPVAPQEKMISVIGPDGQTPVLVPQSQASGMTPFVAGGANKPNSPQSKIADANDALSLLKQAAPLINKSTNSGIGAGVDYLGSLVGVSTGGADTAAKLKSLGGMLVAKMPKMTGPQSDKDVLLYKEMAGRIGDPTIPASQKKAAMETINEIQARYAGVDVTPLDFGDKLAPKRSMLPQNNQQNVLNAADQILGGR